MTKVLDIPLSMPGGSLQAYLQVVNQFPLLSAQEERELAEAYHKENDLHAAWRLVTSHLRFVAKIARGYQGYGLPVADLIQEGSVGLMKAVKHFDPAIGVRLVSFAVHWIRAEIHEFILRNWRIVKVATTKAQRKLFFNLRSAKKQLGWLSPHEVDEIADELGVNAKDVKEMEGRLSATDAAYDMPVDANDDTEWTAPAAYLEDKHLDPAGFLETADWGERSMVQLQSALETLDSRSRDILERRWLAEPKATLQELAAHYGVSAERIRQIETSAMKKLKTILDYELVTPD